MVEKGCIENKWVNIHEDKFLLISEVLDNFGRLFGYIFYFHFFIVYSESLEIIVEALCAEIIPNAKAICENRPSQCYGF